MNIEVYFGGPDEIKQHLDKRPCVDNFDYIKLDKKFTVKSRKLEQTLEEQKII